MNFIENAEVASQFVVFQLRAKFYMKEACHIKMNVEIIDL